MSRTNETRHIEWHETCKCKCKLDPSVCNNKQRWNKDKCRCECKELVDKGICNKGFIWNPSNCDCEFDKLCDIEQYLDSIPLNSIPLNDYKKVCNSCTMYLILFVILLIISFGSVFLYFHWYFKKR